MTDDPDGSSVSRRTVLKASGGALAVPAIGTVGADDGNTGPERQLLDRCPDATFRPSMGHCEGASMEGCADDHPETEALQAAVRESLETRYPDVGSLIDAGFKPYFDTLDTDEDGWSHWINPEYIGDDTVLDPERPESVLVDNDSWRSIGVMFIATRDGDPIDPPPAVYDGDDAVWREGAGDEDVARDGNDYNYDHDHDHGEEGPDGDHDHEHVGDGHDPDYDGDDQDADHDGDGHDADHDGDDHDADHDRDGHENRCSPWHYHAGLPGRFAWWYYRQAYEHDFADGNLEKPCRTPCMMHVWTVDHPEGVYAHDAPPAAYRDQEPAEDPGFETDAQPGEDELDWDVLPDDLVPNQRPNDFSIPGL